MKDKFILIGEQFLNGGYLVGDLQLGVYKIWFFVIR